MNATAYTLLILKSYIQAKTPNSLSRFLNEGESFKSNGLKTKKCQKNISTHVSYKIYGTSKFIYKLFPSLVIHTERNWLFSKESCEWNDG